MVTINHCNITVFSKDLKIFKKNLPLDLIFGVVFSGNIFSSDDDDTGWDEGLMEDDSIRDGFLDELKTLLLDNEIIGVDVILALCRNEGLSCLVRNVVMGDGLFVVTVCFVLFYLILSWNKEVECYLNKYKLLIRNGNNWLFCSQFFKFLIPEIPLPWYCLVEYLSPVCVLPEI